MKTSLSSKIVSQNSTELAPIALDALKNIADLEKDTNVDLKNILVKTKLGGTINDIELFNGVIIPHKSIKIPGGGDV